MFHNRSIRALERTLDTALAEIGELRKERQDLLRALADARDRGDRIVNTLLEAKGAEPIPPSPGPPLPDEDIFAEYQDQVEELRDQIKKGRLDPVEAMTFIGREWDAK